ncbi:MAG: condensin complex protein MksE [Pseudomonadota bacterium]
MFERVIFQLLEGKFICRVSHPDTFDFLCDEDNLRTVVDFLAKIGRRVVRTSKQSGFYLVFSAYGEQERAAIRSHYADIKNNLIPVISFFNLVIRVTGQEDILMYDTAIEADTLMGKIDQDISLRNELQSLGTRFKATDTKQRKLLDSIFKLLVKDGYLKLANPERAIYQVTSKIEYLLDVIKFIHETDETLKIGDEQPESESGSLI